MIIELQDITIKYENGKSAPEIRPVLECFSGILKESSPTIVGGDNGSGKTTLLRVLAGEIGPVSGQILLNGQKVSRRHALPYRTTIGFATQNPLDSILPDQSVLDNLILIKALISGGKKAKLRTQAISFLKDRPFLRTLSERHKDPAQNLSGGWLQLLQLCAVIFAQPKLILLDEPFSQLSESNRRLAERLLNSDMPSDSVLVVATHEPDQLKEIMESAVYWNLSSDNNEEG